MCAAPEVELAAVEAGLWRELEACVHGADHPWRHAVLATRSGDSVDARTVVLREADRRSSALVFYADARSPKVMQLGQCPQAMLVMWSQPLSWQLRLQVRLELATEGLAVSSRWARLALTPAAQDYLSPLPPGSPIERPAVALERGTRDHFSVVTARVEGIDWLELRAEGHRRARFDAEGARWLAP